MGSSEGWEGVVASFDDRFHCVVVDLPGHGNSLGLLEEVYAMDGAAKALRRVFDDLGIHRASVVGYSMGGRLALYFALRFPERCERLFLESASPGLKTEEERASRREADGGKAEWLEFGFFEGFLEGWYRQPLFATLDEAMVESLIERRKENDSRELSKSLRGMGTGSQPSLWDELESLRVPTLALAGGMDGKFTNIAWQMAERGGRISAEVIPSAGHNIHFEAPEEYIRSLEEFLGAGKLK
ncbi:MAG: 2-succinyl-6-hydroxy-2,4-cyclohexadiene-1-carboxylate synthase [Rubrobacter sp.]|nr:2-succinyl-6-hydroxy-2,4-cyclohexadiene-1-carboxylate synthase [Rubrobacter sp.]